MWNFIKGVNPPIKIRKTEDKALYYSEYESSKRVRSYSTEWEKDRPWVKLTDDDMVFLKCVTNFGYNCSGQCVVHVF